MIEPESLFDFVDEFFGEWVLGMEGFQNMSTKAFIDVIICEIFRIFVIF